jgi:hypothetical protein
MRYRRIFCLIEMIVDSIFSVFNHVSLSAFLRGRHMPPLLKTAGGVIYKNVIDLKNYCIYYSTGLNNFLEM